MFEVDKKIVPETQGQYQGKRVAFICLPRTVPLTPPERATIRDEEWDTAVFGPWQRNREWCQSVNIHVLR
jgi:hypothetical protein